MWKNESGKSQRLRGKRQKKRRNRFRAKRHSREELEALIVELLKSNQAVDSTD